MKKVTVYLVTEEREVFVNLTTDDLVRLAELLQKGKSKNTVVVELEGKKEGVTGLFMGFVVLNNDLIPKEQTIFNLVEYHAQ